MDVQLTKRVSRHAPRFPNRILEYSIKEGLSQRSLARLLGRGRNAVSSWERGQTLPNVPKLMLLAKVLATLAEALYIDYYSTRPRDKSSANSMNT